MPEIFDPSTRTSYLAYQFAQSVGLRLEKALRPTELSLAQHNALVQVALSEGISSAEIARRSGMTAQSMGAAVTSLVERGLIVRGPHPTNRRIVNLHPTEAGLALAERSQAAIEVCNAEIFGIFSEEDQDLLTGLLRRLVADCNPDALHLRRRPAEDGPAGDRPAERLGPQGDREQI